MNSHKMAQRLSAILDAMRKLLPDEILPLVGRARNCNVEEADHHLFVRLIAPVHSRGGVRVVRILQELLEPGNDLKPRARFQRARLGQTITELPVEIVIHAQQSFDIPPVAHDVVLESFPSQMHMREEAKQRRVVRQQPQASTR